jgi:parallel beta-helix repeat protein
MRKPVFGVVTSAGIMLTLLMINTLLLAFYVRPASSSLATIIVPDDYPTIQAAINAASDGDTVFVRNGTYYENIVVSKSLVILGENAMSTIIDSHDSGSFNVHINANVTLSGFTLQNGDSGIFVNHPCTVDIKNNIIRNQYYYGVFVQTWGTCNVTVQDNLIVASSGGIQVSYSEGFCALERNNLSQVGSGIMTGYGMMTGNVVNNTITGNGSGTGLDLSDFFNGTIEGNSITGFMDCAWLEGTSGNLVTGNVLAANAGFGLGIISSDDNTVIGNDILNNGFGIWLSSSSRNNVIWHNNFINNSQQVNIVDSSYANTWDDGYPSGGNYWSDYKGLEIYVDGIGDTAYTIDANNTDRYPLMGMFYDFNVSWIEPGYNVELISNSLVSAFAVGFWIEHPNTRVIEFNVTWETDTGGFCRICIPTALLNASYTVLLNGMEIPCILLPFSNSTHSYLYFYFNYNYSTEEVTISPEFPSFLILPLFMIAALLAVMVCKKMRRLQGVHRSFSS